jgi:5-formyltetrahydrofolate cyclo-ligase
LELFWIEAVDELAPRTLGILEPKREIRRAAERRVAVNALDLIVVPGLAFDRSGGRIGHGKGYYDKLLQDTSSDTTTVALSYECQIFQEVPMLDHDMFVDKVVTETAVHEREDF